MTLDVLPAAIGASALQAAHRDPLAYVAAIAGLKAAGWAFDTGALAWRRTAFAVAAASPPATMPAGAEPDPIDAGDDAAGEPKIEETPP